MAIRNNELKNINEYWNALNYIAACQLYLLDNPLLKRKLEMKDIKENVIGHWGTVPGQTMIYAHLNRMIKKYDLEMIYISGPGHGGNAPVSCTYLEGSYTKTYPEITQDEEGMKKLFKMFSFPGGISSHAAPETPGSIHEGGELGYSMAHAYGAVLDNPDLIAATVIGDGEAETGPLSASWNVNRFLNPGKDGVVLPILHLNGFKINNPSIMSRVTKEELYNYFTGLAYNPIFVSGKNPNTLHRKLADALELANKEIKYIKKNYKKLTTIYYPLIVFEHPKGISGPDDIVGTYKAHQVPVDVKDEESLAVLESWLRSYKPENLFDDNGKLLPHLEELNPSLDKVMGLNKHTNGGKLLKDLKKPNLNKCAFKFDKRGTVLESDMMHLGLYLKGITEMNAKNENFRIFGPDEAMSNRFNHVFEVEGKNWRLAKYKGEEMLKDDGRVLDGILSEHVCEGALEGYLLTGRHGLFHTYEAFARVIDSMAGQHAKWLYKCSDIAWREDIASLNIILSSHAWQQDHNGYTHQEPGFLNHLATKKGSVVNSYLPIDANTLVVTMDKVLSTKNKVNAIVASKHPRLQWLSMAEAIEHCEKGIGEFEWASNCKKGKPDIILACAGDTPTLEILAAAQILRQEMPKLNVKVVNAVDLYKLATPDRHPDGLTNKEFDKLFNKDVPVLFSFHGYPSLIYDLLRTRSISNLKVKGYEEEGAITTTFDMRVQNEIDRYHIVLEALQMTKEKNKELEDKCLKTLKDHKKEITTNGKDLLEVSDFKWEE